MIEVRLIRYRDAHNYCAMGQTMFDQRIRPLIKNEIRDGPKFVAYDKKDLDEAIDEYIESRKTLDQTEEKNAWQKESVQLGFNMIKAPSNGVSIKESRGEGCESVYRQALKKKQK